MHACSNQFFLQDFSHHWPGLRPPWFNDDQHVKIIHSTSIHPMKSPFDQTSAAYEPKGYCIISRILRHHGAASMRLPLLDAQATPIDSDRNALIFDFSDWTSVTAWIMAPTDALLSKERWLAAGMWSLGMLMWSLLLWIEDHRSLVHSVIQCTKFCRALSTPWKFQGLSCLPPGF